MKEKDHHIAYSSAINIPGLLLQPGFNTMVVTKRDKKPCNKDAESIRQGLQAVSRLPGRDKVSDKL